LARISLSTPASARIMAVSRPTPSSISMMPWIQADEVVRLTIHQNLRIESKQAKPVNWPPDAIAWRERQTSMFTKAQTALRRAENAKQFYVETWTSRTATAARACLPARSPVFFREARNHTAPWSARRRARQETKK